MSEYINAYVYVPLALLFCLFNSTGNVLQKKGHNKSKQKNVENRINYLQSILKNKVWIIGLLFHLPAFGLHSYLCGVSPQSILNCIEANVVPLNTIFGYLYLHEPLNTSKIIGISFIFIGGCLSAFVAPKKDHTVNLVSLQNNLMESSSIVLFAGLTVIAIINYVIGTYYDLKNREEFEKHGIITRGRTSMFLCFIFVAVYLASMHGIFFKALHLILAAEQLPWNTAFFWVVIIGFPLIFVLTEFFRQKAIKYFDIISVIPLYRTSVVILSIVWSAVVLKEFESINNQQFIIFIGSVCLIVFGIVSVARQVDNEQNEIEQHEDTQTDITNVL